MRAQCAQLSAEVRKLRTEVTATESEVAELQQKLFDSRASKQQVDAQLEADAQQIAQLEGTICNQQAKLVALNQQQLVSSSFNRPPQQAESKLEQEIMKRQQRETELKQELASAEQVFQEMAAMHEALGYQ